MIRPFFSTASILMLALLASACGDDDDDGGHNDTQTFALTSPAFKDGDALPEGATCNAHPFGYGSVPELDWTDGPSGTKSYALVFRDLSIIEARDPETEAMLYDRAFHWSIWDIPANVHRIPAGMGGEQFPSEISGAQQWTVINQFGYLGPCPNFDPTADPSTRVNDHYSFTLYALNVEQLDVPAMQSEHVNYSRTLDDYVQSIAIAKTELHATSDATATEPPPAPDPSTLVYPGAP